MGSEACILSMNQTSTSLRKPWWWRCKNDFAKTFVSHFPCHHSHLFWNHSYSYSIYWVGGVTYILFIAWPTAQQVNQAFIVAIKTKVYFIRFFSSQASKFLSNTYALTNVTPRTTTPSAPYFWWSLWWRTSYFELWV